MGLMRRPARRLASGVLFQILGVHTPNNNHLLVIIIVFVAVVVVVVVGAIVVVAVFVAAVLVVGAAVVVPGHQYRHWGWWLPSGVSLTSTKTPTTTMLNNDSVVVSGLL